MSRSRAVGNGSAAHRDIWDTDLSSSPSGIDVSMSVAPSHAELMKPFFPGQPKSLAGTAMRAFCLGISAALSAVTVAAILLFTSSPLWRPPFFLLALSLFHFLEFWTTAQRNTLIVNTDSFLLTSNWPSYAIAHSAAFIECIIVGVFFPDRQWIAPQVASVLLVSGLVLTILGQIVRSGAMLRAGASFNHQVQSTKASDHVLVTEGIYSVLRHPSYFGFFYWGVGTQLVMGNLVCFFAFTGVLWLFFSTRIRDEEQDLVQFFGDDYVKYRSRVGTWIPFIR